MSASGCPARSREPGAIAVVGMACWYPGARNPLELWENVLARRQEFRAFLNERMPALDYHDADPDAPDRTYGTLGAFLDGFAFDPTAWRVPRSTFASTDIAHWLALDVAAKALADAGHPQGDGLARERTGVVLGNSLTGEQMRANSMRLRWPFVRRLVEDVLLRHISGEKARKMVEAIGERYRGHFPATNEDTLAGALSNTIAGRIAGMFDFGGGGYVVDGACASSLLAVCTAASALQEGRLDACLAGGVDVSLDPFELVGFAKTRALTPTEMRVYDRRGNGFIPGEGCGFVLLKRLADARAAGDRVYAVIEGWGVSSDGRNAITAPKVEGQARAIRQAWSRSGRPDFVEGHGTGTAVGDRVELQALAEVAGEMATGADDSRAIGVTSLKSILGHTKAAAGIGAFLKAVMAVNRRVVPPTAGCGEPNPVFDGPARALFPLRQGAVRSPEGTLRAGTSAMGFGGINTHAVVVSGDPPDQKLAPRLPERALLFSQQDSEIFVLGAPSRDALRDAARDLLAKASGLAKSELADLSASLLDELGPVPAIRAAVIAPSPRELTARVERLLADFPERADGPEIWIGAPSYKPRIGFLCPGQGSQEIDSARSVLARDPELASTAHAWARAAEEEGATGLLETLYPASDRLVDPAELLAARSRLSATELAQPALCLVSLIWAKRLAALGLVPDVVAGHSLGELTAFALAGAFDEVALMRLAAQRGKAMAAAPDRPAGMVSLATDTGRAQELCAAAGGYAAIANVNGPAQVVVSGEAAALERILEEARRRRIPARRLPVSNGFHSELVAEAAERLRREAKVPERAAQPRVTLLSSLVAEPISSACELREHIATHVRRTVDFAGLLDRVAARSDLLVEVGSGRVLTGLLEAALGKAAPRCLPVESVAGRASDLNAVLAAAWVRGAPIRWEALHQGRLVRPFVARRDRLFIANPCEVGRPPTEMAEDRTREGAAPAESRARPADAAQPVARREERRPISNPKAVALRRLVSLVAERTGFDLSLIQPESRLRDDLNLDSIKAGEIVATLVREQGAAERLDPAQLVARPLEEIAAAVAGTHEAAAREPESDPASAKGGEASEVRASHALGLDVSVMAEPAPDPGSTGAPSVWVRAFGLRAVPAAPAAATDWTLARVRVLAPPALQTAIENTLVQAGALIDPAGVDVVAVLSASTTQARVRELRAVVDALGPSARSLFLVQRLDGRFGLVDAGSGAAGAAFARSLSLERPGLSVCVVDVSLDCDESMLLRAIARERTTSPGFTAVGVDATGRYALVASPLTRPAATPRQAGLEAGDLVLVTGGARGITAACVEALARKVRVRLALVGSTPRERVDEEVLRVLGRLALLGIEARYFSCDLSRPDDVEALVKEVRAAQGEIAAVVHGAGRNTPRRVEDVSEEDALLEIAPKLLGAEALMRVLDDAPPRLFVALTSIIGVTGMAGNAWYAFANEALDLALARFGKRHPSCSTRSLAFSVWSAIGMGAKLGSVPFLARMGVSALDPAEGAARFVELVTSDPGVRQPIVTAGFIGLPTWPASWPDDPALRFTLGERRGVPGVEARVRVAPHPDRDVWLRDHDYRGSRLLPTVFGLEAMAQAAWLARGGGDDPVSSIHDIELPSPIVIADHGTLVELRAVVREEDPFAVDCEVRSETTGFSRAHFSATLRFAASLAEAESLALPDLPPPVPDLDPVADLYGGLLFQGPAFHRMGKIRGGNARTMRFVGEVKEPGARERLLLGDPFFRDALLQASQVLVAQDDALPVRIARLGLARGHAEPGPYEVLATIHESRGTAHVANVSVASPDGRRRQWLEGYEVRVLAHHATRPDFETVLRPGRWGEETLRARLSALLAARALPAVTLGLHDVALHGLSRDERHRRIPPLVASLDPGFENALSWEESGRPILRSGRAISIAHDAGCCLIVVGVGEEIAGAKTVTPGLGCDLEPIRGRADWNALLGPSRARLAASLRPQEDRDLAGTRVWAACEALHKAGAANETADRAPSVVSRDGEVVELALGAFRVLTFPLAFPRGSARMVAVAFGPAREQAPLEPSPAAAEQKTPALPDPDLLSVRLVEGRPSRFEARFVVAFDESGSLSGRVPATTLASWMGRLREVALAGLKRPILEALASGQHGMVTQSAWVRLTGEASALDRIEAHVFVEELRPSTCLLRFSFARVAEDGSKQPLGEASQRFGWVHVLGHGEVRGAPFPGFLAEFLADLHVEGATLEHEAPPLLLPRSREATRLRVPTSLADGNVVGNLYYANYFKWAQRALERLVFRNAKEALRARGRLGELTVTSMRLEFLREAMPFDDIDVALHLAVSETGGAQDLAFDLVYTREEADSGVTRLALARVEAVWVPGDGADTEAEEEVRVPTWLRPSPDRERRPVREPFEVATAHRELSTTASVSSPIPNVPAHQEVL